MPNAIAFVAHRSRFLFLLAKRHLVENQQEHKKTFTDEHDAASVNVVEVIVPMIGGGGSLVYLLTFLVFPSAYLTM